MKKTTVRKLSLNRETLALLTESGLREAAGGAGTTGKSGNTCQISICISCTCVADGCG